MDANHSTEQIRFHYYRNISLRHKPPLITLCRLVDQGVTVYAWAICSPTDSPHKHVLRNYDKYDYGEGRDPGGNAIALGRARRTLAKARKQYGDDCPKLLIYNRPVRRKEALEALYACVDEEMYTMTSLVHEKVFDYLPRAMQPPQDKEKTLNA